MKESKKTKKHIKVFGISIPIWVICMLGALFVLPPCIHLFVLLFVKTYLFSAGEILIYYGSVVAFVGTVCLALVALKQNDTVADTNKKLADANEELVEISKRYADANDKLVVLTEKMHEIQMAENVAKFEVEWADRTIMLNSKDNLHAGIFKFNLNTVKGIAFNCSLILIDMYSTDNSWFEEYMNDRVGFLPTQYEQKGIGRFILLHSPHKETILFSVEIPTELLLDKKLFIITSILDFEDMYNRSHSYWLKLIFEIQMDKKLIFSTYSIKPRELRELEDVLEEKEKNN